LFGNERLDSVLLVCCKADLRKNCCATVLVAKSKHALRVRSPRLA
jgi:hypothetical protein